MAFIFPWNEAMRLNGGHTMLFAFMYRKFLRKHNRMFLWRRKKKSREKRTFLILCASFCSYVKLLIFCVFFFFWFICEVLDFLCIFLFICEVLDFMCIFLLICEDHINNAQQEKKYISQQWNVKTLMTLNSSSLDMCYRFPWCSISFPVTNSDTEIFLFFFPLPLFYLSFCHKNVHAYTQTGACSGSCCVSVSQNFMLTLRGGPSNAIGSKSSTMLTFKLAQAMYGKPWKYVAVLDMKERVKCKMV